LIKVDQKCKLTFISIGGYREGVPLLQGFLTQKKQMLPNATQEPTDDN